MIYVEYKLTRVNSVLHGRPWSILFLSQRFFSCDKFTKASEITLKSSEITVKGRKSQLSVEKMIVWQYRPSM